jgi:Glycosyl transferase family 2
VTVAGEPPSFFAPLPESVLSPGEAPTFSVVIPAYQAAGTIPEAITSALGQSAAPCEVIVSDDGSTDDIAGAVAQFRDQILVIRDENAGAAAARNRGLAVARGEFVAFLDSDDVWLPHYLERLGELAVARPDLDLLSTDVFYEADGEVVGRFYEVNRFDVANQRHAIFRSCFVGWPVSRRSRLAAAGGFDESLKIAHDWDAWARLIVSGAKAGVVMEPLARYRLRPGSLASDVPRSLRERAVFLEKLAGHPDLRPEDGPALSVARRRAENRALVAEATEALAAGAPEARRRALGVALARGLDWKRRLLGLGAAALPRVAGATLRRRLATESTQAEPRRSRVERSR